MATARDLLITSLVIFSTIIQGVGQTTEYSGWFFSSNNYKIGKTTKIFTDIQVRSVDDLKSVGTLLLRPGITVELKKKQEITVGYTYFGTWEEVNDIRKFELEHRIWEQYMIATKIMRIEISNRLRLEQRFLENDKFAQRLRYYFRSQIPLSLTGEFAKGAYFAIQEEVFLNVQNKGNVNNEIVDQNRIYGGIGFRFNERVEVEVGYMFRYQIEKDEILKSHIIQLSLDTQL